MQKKSFFVYASVVAVLMTCPVTPGLARQAQKAMNTNSYQVDSASSSYAFEPQTTGTTIRSGRCWIATDASRGYGYMDSCANPLARDPSLDPSYNPEW
jgi:hypothetical protein